MRVRLATALAATALVLPFAVTSAGAALAVPGGSIALPGSAPLLLRSATTVGRPDPAAQQQVTLVLALRDRAGLARLLQAQITPGSADDERALTPTQFAARFAPSPALVARVRSWARSNGLRVTEVSGNRTLVTMTAARRTLERAFTTTLLQRGAGGQIYVTPSRTATLPADIQRGAVALLGLTTYNPARLPLVVQPAARASDGPFFGPAELAKIYHAPVSPSGAGQTVAVITQGDLTGVRHDLAVFRQRFSLPSVRLSVIQTTADSSDTSGAMEYDLDTQYAAGMAPGVKTILAYNGNTLGAIQPLNRFVTDRKALTASASYGGCELLNQALGDVAADDQVFAQAQAQGQTFWVSSGDTGTTCMNLTGTAADAALIDVNYPASSPYVVAVGGTSLPRFKAETTWTGGGGGQSGTERAPSWQPAAGAFQPLLGRGVPDVSLDADPNTGYDVATNGGWAIVGGTSASAPAWNGIWARVLQAHPKAGFASPKLYGLGRPGLRDITTGSNGFYSAGPGYDLSTGLGSVDIARLISLIR